MIVGPFSTIGEAEDWMGLCDVPTMRIHPLRGPTDALKRGHAQMENWKTPFGFKEWAEGEEPETGRRYYAKRKGYRKETRRQVP
jgi:hypothetical protein